MVWDDLRAFLAVYRRGSHKGAARLLGVDPTTVSRRMAALERNLAARLFVRTPERLVPTAAGDALLPRAERVEAEVMAAEREMQGVNPELEGPLRVTAGDGMVNYLVLPALAGLLREHPALAVELRAENRVVDLSRREADLAIRLVRPREPALVARRLGQMPYAIFAAAEYLERRGTPRSLAAAAAHPWIGFDQSLDRLPQVQWLRRTVPGLSYLLRANTTTTQVVACAEGHGLALLPTFTARREPRLRRLFPRLPGPARDMWGVTHADLRGTPRVTAFLGWLAALVEEAQEVRRPMDSALSSAQSSSSSTR
jgi:DNA-binding transcriptional LysR family regulator